MTLSHFNILNTMQKIALSVILCNNNVGNGGTKNVDINYRYYQHF